MPLYELIKIKKYMKKDKDGNEKEENLWCHVGKIFMDMKKMKDINQKKVGEGHFNESPNEPVLVMKPRLFKPKPSVDF